MEEQGQLSLRTHLDPRVLTKSAETTPCSLWRRRGSRSERKRDLAWISKRLKEALQVPNGYCCIANGSTTWCVFSRTISSSVL